MLTITITSTNPATFEVRLSSPDCDIFALVIGDLKRRVPAHLRNYSPTWKCWYIKRQAAHYLTQWIEQARETFGATVEGDPGPWTRGRRPEWESSYEYEAPPPRGPRAVPSEAEAFATLYLLPSAPAPLIKVAYKTLAQIHHPDKGGDASEMRKLNDAIETLKAKLAA